MYWSLNGGTDTINLRFGGVSPTPRTKVKCIWSRWYVYHHYTEQYLGYFVWVRCLVQFKAQDISSNTLLTEFD